jgi:23S rRNA pseudouridine2457 synthase
MKTIIIGFNKPYNVLCQFTDIQGRKNLSKYIYNTNIYPAGRLDYNSEGLVILTNNGLVQHKISDPESKLWKNYLLQVDGEITADAVCKLDQGLKIKGRNTALAMTQRITEPDWIWPRIPPIRYRKNIPTSWVEMKIHEGKKHQIRHMTAAVGFPTLRLIRIGIGDYRMINLLPGEWTDIDPVLLNVIDFC